MVEQRRKKGDGTIIEYKPGKWLAGIKINGKQFSFYGTSEKEVIKKLKEFKNKVALGKTDNKRISYETFLRDDYLKWKKLSLKPQSFNRLESTISYHIIPLLGFYDVDKIDATTIQEDVINPKSKELSYSSIKKYMML